MAEGGIQTQIQEVVQASTDTVDHVVSQSPPALYVQIVEVGIITKESELLQRHCFKTSS